MAIYKNNDLVIIKQDISNIAPKELAEEKSEILDEILDNIIEEQEIIL